MQFISLRKELKNVIFEVLREDRDNYFEAVVVKEELAKLTAQLEKFLGSAISSLQLSPQVWKSLKEFGGVRPGQVLYLKAGANDTVIAMLWPWNDSVRTTVKIINKE